MIRGVGLKRINTAKWVETRQRWQINVQRDGVRKTFTSSKPGRNGQREANAKADEWLEQGLEKTNFKISTLAKEYIEDLRERTSQSNWRPEESRVDNWVNPNIGNIKANKLTEQHLQNIINKAYKKGLSKKSLRNLRATLFSLCKYMRKCKASSFYPEYVVIPKAAYSKNKTILQPADIVKLLTSDETICRGKTIKDEWANAYRFQVLTGIRPGELFGLKKKDVKLPLIHIREAVNVYGETTKGKNENAQRDIAINSLSEEVLKDELKKDNGVYVFPRISSEGYRLRLIRYCEHNKIPIVTPYELRHTFVSIVQDLPEGALRDIVGHSKNMDTLGTYAHQVKGKKIENATKVEAIFREIILDKVHE